MTANQNSLKPRSGLWRRWQEIRLIGQDPVLGLALAGQRGAAVRYDPGETALYPVGAAVGVALIEENLYLIPG